MFTIEHREQPRLTQLNENAAQGRYKSVPPDADRAVARVVSASELNPVARNFRESA
jgi:hypothetical protein